MRLNDVTSKVRTLEVALPKSNTLYQVQVPPCGQQKKPTKESIDQRKKYRRGVFYFRAEGQPWLYKGMHHRIGVLVVLDQTVTTTELVLLSRKLKC